MKNLILLSILALSLISCNNDDKDEKDPNNYMCNCKVRVEWVDLAIKYLPYPQGNETYKYNYQTTYEELKSGSINSCVLNGKLYERDQMTVIPTIINGYNITYRQWTKYYECKK